MSVPLRSRVIRDGQQIASSYQARALTLRDALAVQEVVPGDYVGLGSTGMRGEVFYRRTETGWQLMLPHQYPSLT